MITLDATWVLLGAMGFIALVALHRIYRTANSRDMKIELEHKRILELSREETLRLQLLVNVCGQGKCSVPVKTLGHKAGQRDCCRNDGTEKQPKV